jgi:hypothetical protein
MEEEIFYIYFQEAFWNMTGAIHLERIFTTKEGIISHIDGENGWSFVITNDRNLLKKYIVVFNEDEFKMFCGKNNYVKSNIRINKSNYLFSCSVNTFECYEKIKNQEIVSASAHRVQHEDFLGDYFIDKYVINKKFFLFPTPERYLRNEEKNKVFHLTDITEAGLLKLSELLNINILEIGKSEGDQNINWEFRKDMLRYYDKESCRRLYISKEHLERLTKENNLIYLIDTQFDKNFYIEYYVTGVKGDELSNNISNASISNN